jgi:hypothetical protein
MKGRRQVQFNRDRDASFSATAGQKQMSEDEHYQS